MWIQSGCSGCVLEQLLRLDLADAGREARHDTKHVGAARSVELRRSWDGHPQLLRLGVGRHGCRIHWPSGINGVRHYSDDDVRLAAEAQRLADDIASASEPLAPECL